MRKTIWALALIALSGQAEAEPRLYFITPQHGETLSSPITVRFGLNGMGIAPAGVDRENTGHHHLLIDVDILPPLDSPLPSSEQIRHFGGGQTEVELALPPGEHTLQLVLGNHAHVPHQPPLLSERITITVSDP